MEKLSAIYEELWREMLSDAEAWAIEGGCRMGPEQLAMNTAQCMSDATDIIKRIREAEDDM